MLTFTDRTEWALQLILELAYSPGSALRISARGGRDAVLDGSDLEMTITSDFRRSDELVLAPGGVPVFIEREIAPVLEGAIIDVSLSGAGRPQFVLHRS
jgi:Fe-S cluster assembly iron-binding protein IscA